MRIREATRADEGAITALWNAAISESLATFTTVLKSEADVATIVGGPCLVAEIDGEFSGFASYGPFRPGPGYAQTGEVNIYLTTPAQGRGVGRKLLGALEDVARSQGIHVMVAGISSANPGAVAFHEACGCLRMRGASLKRDGSGTNGLT